MNKQVYLIQPSFHKMNGELVKGWSQANCSVDLPMLSATIPEDWDKEVCSEYYNDINYESEATVIFVVAMSVDIRNAYNIIKKFKKLGKKIIFGGHQDSFSEKILKEVCDSCYVGTPNSTQMKELLQDVVNGNLSPEYQFGINIDFPFDYSVYKGKKVRYIQILSSLGCIYSCDYCWHQISYGGGVKLRNIDYIIQDLRAVKKITSYVGFRDPNFYNKKKHTINLCKRIIKEKLNIKWGVQCPIIIGSDDETLDLMYKAGCRIIFIGFESLEKKNLQSVNKHFDPDTYKEFALNIQKHGINVVGYFMFGFDYDTPELYDKVFTFIKEAKLSLPILNILTPVPGTKLYERMKKEGRIDYPDADNYLENSFLYSIPCNKCYFDHPSMSRAEIESNFIRLHRRLTTFNQILSRGLKPNLDSFMLLKMNLDLRKDRKKMEAIQQ
jgi:radical SAM superfamily enzyme YgiQ (UPF0313 family)